MSGIYILLALVVLCRLPTTETRVTNSCAARLDIAFVVDNSANINENGAIDNWTKVLAFLRNVASRLAVREDRVRVGMGVFSTSARVDFLMNECHSRGEMMAAIGRSRYRPIGANINIATGIELARNKIFNAANGDRPGVRNLMILVTSGVPDEKEAEALTQAEITKTEGTSIITIGIKDEVDESLLRNIASADLKIKTKDFNTLQNEVDKLIGMICWGFSTAG